MNQAVLDKKPIHPGDDVGPQVFFEHVASLHEVNFHVAWTETLQSAWDQACKLLGEDKRPEDRLQNDDGVDLMGKLGWTFRQLAEDKHTKSRKFQIIGPTGGATQ